MAGLKDVRQRRNDALSRIGWDRLEALLAVYYRDLGYAVDHCGTGASGSRFDGGIDLKLRKGEQYVLVQCKHWNAKQVPHNDVHQLLGLMVNEGATGAILVTSGEFTPAARTAAQKLGHVQLVDGDGLREMMGPLPELEPEGVFDSIGLSVPRAVREAGERAGERLLRAAEDRIRYEGRRATGTAMQSVLAFALFKLAAVALLLLFAWFALKMAFSTIEDLGRSPDLVPEHSVRKVGTAAIPQSPAREHAAQGRPQACRELVDAPAGTYIDHCADQAVQGPTAEELRELQRRADEAAKVLEHSTPEM